MTESLLPFAEPFAWAARALGDSLAFAEAPMADGTGAYRLEGVYRPGGPTEAGESRMIVVTDAGLAEGGQAIRDELARDLLVPLMGDELVARIALATEQLAEFASVRTAGAEMVKGSRAGERLLVTCDEHGFPDEELRLPPPFDPQRGGMVADDDPARFEPVHLDEYRRVMLDIGRRAWLYRFAGRT